MMNIKEFQLGNNDPQSLGWSRRGSLSSNAGVSTVDLLEKYKSPRWIRSRNCTFTLPRPVDCMYSTKVLPMDEVATKGVDGNVSELKDDVQARSLSSVSQTLPSELPDFFVNKNATLSANSQYVVYAALDATGTQRQLVFNSVDGAEIARTTISRPVCQDNVPNKSPLEIVSVLFCPEKPQYTLALDSCNQVSMVKLNADAATVVTVLSLHFGPEVGAENSPIQIAWHSTDRKCFYTIHQDFICVWNAAAIRRTSDSVLTFKRVADLSKFASYTIPFGPLRVHFSLNTFSSHTGDKTPHSSAAGPVAALLKALKDGDDDDEDEDDQADQKGRKTSDKQKDENSDIPLSNNKSSKFGFLAFTNFAIPDNSSLAFNSLAEFISPPCANTSQPAAPSSGDDVIICVFGGHLGCWTVPVQTSSIPSESQPPKFLGTGVIPRDSLSTGPSSQRDDSCLTDFGSVKVVGTKRMAAGDNKFRELNKTKIASLTFSPLVNVLVNGVGEAARLENFMPRQNETQKKSTNLKPSHPTAFVDDASPSAPATNPLVHHLETSEASSLIVVSLVFGSNHNTVLHTAVLVFCEQAQSANAAQMLDSDVHDKRQKGNRMGRHTDTSFSHSTSRAESAHKIPSVWSVYVSSLQQTIELEAMGIKPPKQKTGSEYFFASLTAVPNKCLMAAVTARCFLNEADNAEDEDLREETDQSNMRTVDSLHKTVCKSLLSSFCANKQDPLSECQSLAEKKLPYPETFDWSFGVVFDIAPVELIFCLKSQPGNALLSPGSQDMFSPDSSLKDEDSSHTEREKPAGTQPADSETYQHSSLSNYVPNLDFFLPLEAVRCFRSPPLLKAPCMFSAEAGLVSFASYFHSFQWEPLKVGDDVDRGPSRSEDSEAPPQNELLYTTINNPKAKSTDNQAFGLLFTVSPPFSLLKNELLIGTPTSTRNQKGGHLGCKVVSAVKTFDYPWTSLRSQFSASSAPDLAAFQSSDLSPLNFESVNVNFGNSSHDVPHPSQIGLAASLDPRFNPDSLTASAQVLYDFGLRADPVSAGSVGANFPYPAAFDVTALASGRTVVDQMTDHTSQGVLTESVLQSSRTQAPQSVPGMFSTPTSAPGPISPPPGYSGTVKLQGPSSSWSNGTGIPAFCDASDTRMLLNKLAAVLVRELRLLEIRLSRSMERDRQTFFPDMQSLVLSCLRSLTYTQQQQTASQNVPFALTHLAQPANKENDPVLMELQKLRNALADIKSSVSARSSPPASSVKSSSRGSAGNAQQLSEMAATAGAHKMFVSLESSIDKTLNNFLDTLSYSLNEMIKEEVSVTLKDELEKQHVNSGGRSEDNSVLVKDVLSGMSSKIVPELTAGFTNSMSSHLEENFDRMENSILNALESRGGAGEDLSALSSRIESAVAHLGNKLEAIVKVEASSYGQSGDVIAELKKFHRDIVESVADVFKNQDVVISKVQSVSHDLRSLVEILSKEKGRSDSHFAEMKKEMAATQSMMQEMFDIMTQRLPPPPAPIRPLNYPNMFSGMLPDGFETADPTRPPLDYFPYHGVFRDANGGQGYPSGLPSINAPSCPVHYKPGTVSRPPPSVIGSTMTLPAFHTGLDPRLIHPRPIEGLDTQVLPRGSHRAGSDRGEQDHRRELPLKQPGTDDWFDENIAERFHGLIPAGGPPSLKMSTGADQGSSDRVGEHALRGAVGPLGRHGDLTRSMNPRRGTEQLERRKHNSVRDDTLESLRQAHRSKELGSEGGKGGSDGDWDYKHDMEAYSEAGKKHSTDKRKHENKRIDGKGGRDDSPVDRERRVKRETSREDRRREVEKERGKGRDSMSQRNSDRQSQQSLRDEEEKRDRRKDSKKEFPDRRHRGAEDGDNDDSLRYLKRDRREDTRSSSDGTEYASKSKGSRRGRSSWKDNKLSRIMADGKVFPDNSGSGFCRNDLNSRGIKTRNNLLVLLCKGSLEELFCTAMQEDRTESAGGFWVLSLIRELDPTTWLSGGADQSGLREKVNKWVSKFHLGVKTEPFVFEESNVPRVRSAILLGIAKVLMDSLFWLEGFCDSDPSSAEKCSVGNPLAPRTQWNAKVFQNSFTEVRCRLLWIRECLLLMDPTDQILMQAQLDEFFNEMLRVCTQLINGLKNQTIANIPTSNDPGSSKSTQIPVLLDTVHTIQNSMLMLRRKSTAALKSS